MRAWIVAAVVACIGCQEPAAPHSSEMAMDMVFDVDHAWSNESAPEARTFPIHACPASEPPRFDAEDRLAATPSRLDVVHAMEAVATDLSSCGAIDGVVRASIVFESSGSASRVSIESRSEHRDAPTAPQIACWERVSCFVTTPPFSNPIFGVVYPIAF